MSERPSLTGVAASRAMGVGLEEFIEMLSQAGKIVASRSGSGQDTLRATALNTALVVLKLCLLALVGVVATAIREELEERLLNQQPLFKAQR